MCLLGLFALIYSNNNLLKYAVTLFNTFRSIFVSFVGNIWTLYSFYLFSKFHLTFLFFIQFFFLKSSCSYAFVSVLGRTSATMISLPQYLHFIKLFFPFCFSKCLC